MLAHWKESQTMQPAKQPHYNQTNEMLSIMHLPNMCLPVAFRIQLLSLYNNGLCPLALPFLCAWDSASAKCRAAIRQKNVVQVQYCGEAIEKGAHAHRQGVHAQT